MRAADERASPAAGGAWGTSGFASPGPGPQGGGNREERGSKASSSNGRAAVSKTACWGFESLLACQFASRNERRGVGRRGPRAFG
jgi:hypothetical protein